MAGIASMLRNRAARHEAALRRYADAAEAARARAAAACEAAARRLADSMGACDRDIESRMGLLDDSRIMRLNAKEIEQVWGYVLQRAPERQAWLQQLEADLQSVEATRRTDAEAALADLIVGMQDASHVDEGAAQRLVQAEALGLSQALLEDRWVSAVAPRCSHWGLSV